MLRLSTKYLSLLLLLVGCTASASESFIRLKDDTPAGFENLASKQTTQADVYFGGEYLVGAFITYDLTTVEFDDPLAVVEGIPNLATPEKIAKALSGALPTNATQLCTVAKRDDCGRLNPEIAAVIFDEGRYRVDLFIAADELLLHEIQREKYLPPPTVTNSMLHNIRTHAAGSGQDLRFSLGAESFLAYEQSRLRSRYTLSDEGFRISEFSWQRDDEDHEYEVGSFRTLGRNLSFVSDTDVVGVRLATSTKRRIDIEDARATPIMVFIPQRSRVEVYRGDELLDTRFYNAGNQQIDTGNFPDGAYELTVKATGLDGQETVTQHYFVRSHLMAPSGEPQHHFEMGKLAELETYDSPRVTSHTWIRAGGNRRLSQNSSTDYEFVHVGGENFLQAGLLYLKPEWHLQSSVLRSNEGTTGIGIAGGYRRGSFGLFVDYRQLELGQTRQAAQDFTLHRTSYRQGSLTVSFPFAQGQMFVRGRINKRGERYSSVGDSGFGLSYLGTVFNRGGITGDLTLDSHFGSEQKWFRLGLTVRWRNGREYGSVRPMFEYLRGSSSDFSNSLDARWNRRGAVPRLGEFDQAFFASHDAQHRAIGARLTPSSSVHSNYELRYEQNQYRSDIYYAANNSFNIVTTNGRTTIGDGGQQAGAVVVDIDGNVAGRFEVIVDGRVVGSAWAGRRNVISMRPYETYDIRIRPASDKIVGYDQLTQRVTLYPGNVETVTFTAKEIIVLISRAIYADGTPVQRGRFDNVEGFGATDDDGWFQVEIASRAPLRINTQQGECTLNLPDFYADQGLAVLDEIVCEIVH